MNCDCGKAAIYRVGELGYCARHREQAVERLAKFGNPKANRKNPKTILHVDKPTTRDKRIEFQRHLRAAATFEELALRKLLSKNEETKRKYVFQPCIDGYYPDFLYRKARLIIELDGAHHRTTAGKRKDARRSGHLGEKGYKVIRFMNSQMREVPDYVLSTIVAEQRARLANDVRRKNHLASKTVQG